MSSTGMPKMPAAISCMRSRTGRHPYLDLARHLQLLLGQVKVELVLAHGTEAPLRIQRRSLSVLRGRHVAARHAAGAEAVLERERVELVRARGQHRLDVGRGVAAGGQVELVRALAELSG